MGNKKSAYYYRGQSRAVLNEEKKGLLVPRFPINALMCGDWRLVAVGGGWWCLVAVGGWGLVVAGGWQWLAAVDVWRLVAVGGGWWLAVDDPLERSRRVVLNKKKSRPQRTALGQRLIIVLDVVGRVK